MRQLRALLLAVALPCMPAALEAQRTPGAPGEPGRARREQMEQQLRRTLWTLAKERIGFTDAQMTRLEQTSTRFDARRRALVTEERAQRLTLRTELAADAQADQDRVARALDRLHQLQRQRLDLQVEEQREFATFMTPVQRAKYAALQEQVRRRVESLRRQRADSTPRSRH
jgi:hypothetical protein